MYVHVYLEKSLECISLQNAVVVHKARHNGHVIVLLLLCCVTNSCMDVKVSADDINVGPLILLGKTKLTSTHTHTHYTSPHTHAHSIELLHIFAVLHLTTHQ